MKPRRQSVTAIVIKSVLVGILAIAVGFAAAWIISGERRSEEISQRECIIENSRAFTGVVRSVNRFEWNQHMNNEYFGLSIKVSDKSSVDYMFEKEHHEELAQFVQPNDSIIKPAGTDSFIVMKDDGLARHFVLPACGEE